MSTTPVRYLSLGAGVQSSALLLLALHGRIPTFDAATFADTGWEPAAATNHLDSPQRLAAADGIPMTIRVSTGTPATSRTTLPRTSSSRRSGGA